MGTFSLEGLIGAGFGAIREKVVIPISIRREDRDPISPEQRRLNIKQAEIIVSQAGTVRDFLKSKSAEACFDDAVARLNRAKYIIDKRLVLEIGRRRFSVAYQVFSSDAYLAALSTGR